MSFLKAAWDFVYTVWAILFVFIIFPLFVLNFLSNRPIDWSSTFSGSSSDGDPGLVNVSPYNRSDGTPVRGHQRTWPDGDSSNNFSSPSGLSRDTSLSGLSSGNGSFSF